VSATRIVLLVLREFPPTLVKELSDTGFETRSTTAREAAHQVSHGQAALVVCERLPGWQALVTQIIQADGAVIVFGPELSAEERRRLPHEWLTSGDTTEAVVKAVKAESEKLEARSLQTLTAEGWTERALNAERINRVAQLIAAKIDLPHVIQEAIARTCELCEADGASLLLIDPHTGELCFDSTAGGAADSLKQVRLRKGDGIAGAVALSATSVLVPDVRVHPQFNPDCDRLSGFSTGSVVAVPLLLGGDILGVLEAVRHDGRQPFNADHLRRLEELSPHVTIAVHHARTMAQLYQTQKEILAWNADLEGKVNERTEQISKAKREWEQTFDAINEPLALQDGFTIRRANLAYAQHVGIPLSQVPGKTCYRILAKRDTPCPSCPLLQGREAPLSGEIAMGTHHIFDFSGFRMSQSSADSGVVVHYRDVTRQKSLETRLRETERLAAVGQLASGAAHEINNPIGFLISNLTSLAGLVSELAVTFKALDQALDLHQRGKTESALTVLNEIGVQESLALLMDGKEMIAESLNGARRVAAIVKALRELSKQSTQRAEPAALAASVSRAVQAELRDRLADVIVSVPEDLWTSIPPLQLDQLIVQLLRNARQASNAGQGISVSAGIQEGAVTLEVTDAGCGIPQEHLHRLFEPFFTTRGIGNGVGLGLTAVYGIVHRYGGNIEVQSEVEKGSTFRLKLPRVDVVDTQQPDEPLDEALLLETG
jgi:two-component system NtrC family sensor kinase